MSERDEFEAAMGWKLKDSQGKHALSRAHDSQQTYTFLATYWAYEAWQAARATPQQAVPALTDEDIERQYKDGIDIGSGLPRATCPCGFCQKYREPR